jgi:hypothetical protein
MCEGRQQKGNMEKSFNRVKETNRVHKGCKNLGMRPQFASVDADHMSICIYCDKKKAKK